MGHHKEHTSPLDLVKIVIVVCTLGGLLVGGGTWVYQMTQLIATKTYHQADQHAMADAIKEAMLIAIEPVKSSAYNTETEATITRILRLHGIRCATGTRDWNQQIRELKARFKELNDRDFIGAVECPP